MSDMSKLSNNLYILMKIIQLSFLGLRAILLFAVSPQDSRGLMGLLAGDPEQYFATQCRHSDAAQILIQVSVMSKFDCCSSNSDIPELCCLGGPRSA